MNSIWKCANSEILGRRCWLNTPPRGQQKDCSILWSIRMDLRSLPMLRYQVLDCNTECPQFLIDLTFIGFRMGLMHVVVRMVGLRLRGENYRFIGRASTVSTSVLCWSVLCCISLRCGFEPMAASAVQPSFPRTSSTWRRSHRRGMTRAATKVAIFVRIFLWMTCLLKKPKIAGIRPPYFEMIFVVYLGHEIFHPVCSSF